MGDFAPLLDTSEAAWESRFEHPRQVATFRHFIPSDGVFERVDGERTVHDAVTDGRADEGDVFFTVDDPVGNDALRKQEALVFSGRF